MMFQTVKAALAATLDANSNGDFVVDAFQDQMHDATQILNNSRMVHVFYMSGTFPKNVGTTRGSVAHELTFQLQLLMSMAAGCDLSALENPEATAAERMAAISGMQDSIVRMDAVFDNFVNNVFGIVMSPANADLGLGYGIIANRWISHIHKDPPTTKGEYIVMSGILEYQCRCIEDLTGLTPVPLNGIIDIGLQINGDTVTQTIVDVPSVVDVAVIGSDTGAVNDEITLNKEE